MLDECDEVDAGTLRTSFQRPPPAFSLQNLRYALTAADYGSFRRAAEALLLRQSTLSRCVRQLEESIGMAVFERSSGGVRATQAGRQFLRSAHSILEQVEALAARTHSTGNNRENKLPITMSRPQRGTDCMRHSEKLRRIAHVLIAYRR